MIPQQSVVGSAAADLATQGRSVARTTGIYPVRWATDWSAPNGLVVHLRPIRATDAAMEQAFVDGLSSHSRYLRFMGTVRSLTPAMLTRFTQIDYDREMAFVATITTGAGDTEIAVSRYIAPPEGDSCEFALTVADDWQRLGLGRRMLQILIEVARQNGLKTMTGDVLAENRGMLALCRNLGFAVVKSDDGPGVLRTELDLRQKQQRPLEKELTLQA